MITVFIAVIAKVKLVIMRLFAYVMVKFIRIRKVLILMRYMTDEQLKTMTKDEANKTLSYEDKVRWAVLQNSKANIYFIKHGNIEDVPAEGWWY